MATWPKPVVTVALMLALAGCGKAIAPTAPKSSVDKALSGLATTCAHARETSEFGARPADIRHLDAAASSYASHLAGIYRRDPSATYLGQSMARVLDTEISDARTCGLPGTARLMAAARSGKQ